jgi:hypothetical protein
LIRKKAAWLLGRAAAWSGKGQSALAFGLAKEKENPCKPFDNLQVSLVDYF